MGGWVDGWMDGGTESDRYLLSSKINVRISSVTICCQKYVNFFNLRLIDLQWN